MVAAGSAVAPCAEAVDSMAVAAFTAAVDSTAADADKSHTSIHTRGSNGRQENLPAVFFLVRSSVDSRFEITALWAPSHVAAGPEKLRRRVIRQRG